MSLESTSDFDRQQAVRNAITESELSDLKQHAMKMLRDFEKFNDFSSNRAIWELVQNACDLTTQCEIVVDYRNNKFTFSHNGRPFTSNSLLSLVKQVSGDKDKNNEIPSVGKYGTGFLTTHSFGRKFVIDSLLETAGTYVEIKNFLIDRSAKNWEDLVVRIREQKEKVLDIIATGAVVNRPVFETTFTYLPETDQEKSYIVNSFNDLEEYVPIVLTINSRIKSFEILSADDQRTKFVLSKRDEVPNDKGINLYKTTITQNDIEQILYSITDDDREIEIILPVLKDLTLRQFSDRVARLFLYYPLIGSGHFGINFIINSTAFLPTEPRDGIHLKSNKDQVKDQEEVNRELIQRASHLLFKFLNSEILPVKNPLLYAHINFKRNSDDQLLNEYFTGLQRQWVDEYSRLPIVETKAGYKSVPEIVLIDPVMLASADNFDCIYYLLEKFYDNVPSKETIAGWSQFVSKWDYDQAIFVTNTHLVEHLDGKQLADFDDELLRQYYKYLIQNEISLVTSYNKRLIPNIDGDFQSFNNLRRARNIDEQLLVIGRELIPESIEQLIDPRFSFNFFFENYTRKDFSNSINTKLSEIITESHVCLPDDHNPESMEARDPGISPALPFDMMQPLLNYCKLHTYAASQSKPSRLMALISGYYQLSTELIPITPPPNGDDDIDVRQAQKKAVKIFFNTLLLHNEAWVEDNLTYLHDILSCWDDSYKEVYSSSKIYPNQLYKLSLLAELKKDAGLEPTIVKLYNDVTRNDIRSILAHLDFNDFMADNEEVTNKTLSAVIEELFFETDIWNINDHPFRDEILGIISKLNDIKYKNLFPRLDDKKANLMLEVVLNDKTRDDIFFIITLEEHQINKLSRLVKLGNLDELLAAAESIVKLEKEQRSDFHHKYTIGAYIERRIRERLTAEISSKFTVQTASILAIEEVQRGQDIIIFYDLSPVYFIEVKSRWGTNSSVSMSKLQLEVASKNIDRYALISVDVTKYRGGGDRYKLEESEIIELVKVIDGIGSDIKPLIEKNLLAEVDPLSPAKLSDYRGIINQETIGEGLNFETFVENLIEKLTDAIAVL
jgi:hypothetical protein